MNKLLLLACLMIGNVSTANLWASNGVTAIINGEDEYLLAGSEAFNLCEVLYRSSGAESISMEYRDESGLYHIDHIQFMYGQEYEDQIVTAVLNDVNDELPEFEGANFIVLHFTLNSTIDCLVRLQISTVVMTPLSGTPVSDDFNFPPINPDAPDGAPSFNSLPAGRLVRSNAATGFGLMNRLGLRN